MAQRQSSCAYTLVAHVPGLRMCGEGWERDLLALPALSSGFRAVGWPLCLWLPRLEPPPPPPPPSPPSPDLQWWWWTSCLMLRRACLLPWRLRSAAAAASSRLTWPMCGTPPARAGTGWLPGLSVSGRGLAGRRAGFGISSCTKSVLLSAASMAGRASPSAPSQGAAGAPSLLAWMRFQIFWMLV